MSNTKNSIIIIAAFALIALFITVPVYSEEIRLNFALIAFGVGLLALLALIVMLFKKSWRKQFLYIPLSVGLGCIAFFALMMTDIHFTKDADKEAKKVANRVAKEQSLDIMNIEKDTSKYYIVTARKKLATDKDINRIFEIPNDEVRLYVSVNGKWNQNSFLYDSKNLKPLSLNLNQINLLDKGGYFNENKLGITDNSIANVTDYDEYFEYLKNELAKLNPSIKREYIYFYTDSNGARIKLRLSSYDGDALSNPKLLFIFDENIDKREVVSLRNITLSNHDAYENEFIIKAGKGAETVNVYVIPSEILNDAWTQNKLLSCGNYFWNFYSSPHYKHFREVSFLEAQYLGMISGLEQNEVISNEEKEDMIQKAKDDYKKWQQNTQYLKLFED